MAAVQSEQFADAVSRMVLRVALLEESGKPGFKGLTAVELQELSFLCTAQDCIKPSSGCTINSSNDDVESPNVAGFASVEGDPLLALIELLDQHVNNAISVHLIEAAIEVYQSAGGSPSQANAALEQWCKNGEGKARLATLRGGLEAAAIILFIATTRDVDRRAIHEDAIEACITLLRLHLTKHIVPALNQTGHFIGSETEPASPGGKKRRRSSGPAAESAAVVPGKDLKKFYNYICGTIQLQLILMNRCERLVQILPLDDQQVLLLATGALPALEIDCNATSPSKSVPPAQQLQLALIGIITSAFRKYPLHRDTILEDLFPVMLRLPTGKRSLRTFPVSYQSAASPSALEALNAQMVGSLLVNQQQLPHYIQMMTALVISLVQSCVVRPTYLVVEKDAGEHEPGRLQSGLQTAQAVADSFVVQLLKRCTRAKGGEVSEFRPILANFVEDLLLVLIIPEYPAAELLVSVLQLRLNQDLMRASSVFSKQSQIQVDATYLNAAFDAMGKICAVQARILATSRDKPIHMITDVPMSSSTNDDSEGAQCHCRQTLEAVFALACDHCNAVFHGQCVGIPDRDSAPEQWYCDGCCLGKIAAREQRKLQGAEAAYIDQNYVLQHSFQSVTAHRLGVDMGDAVHFHLARWIDFLERRDLTDNSLTVRPRKIVAQLLDFWDVPGPAAEPLTDEGGVRVILALLANTSSLFQSFRKQIGFLLSIMADESSHSLRKLSLKVIEKTVDADHKMMSSRIIADAVSRRLSDESISVREAAVSLVGSYAVTSPVAIQRYHAALLPCLTDEGVSVRKRAVKIFQTILTTNPRYKGRSAVCNILLQRSADPKEEDAVRDLVDDVFCALWLCDGDEELSPKKHCTDSIEVSSSTKQAVAIPGVVTPSSPATLVRHRKIQRRSDVAAEQMMECVRASASGNSLEALLQKLLNGSIDSDSGRRKSERQKRQELGMKQCTQLVDALFELLMVVEEQREIRPHVGNDIAATLTTLAVFANVSPHAVLQHLDTILPYLKADNGGSTDDESAIVCASCDILYRLAAADALDQQAIARLAASAVADDLKDICFKFRPAAVNSGVRAFTALALRAGDKSRFDTALLKLAKTFYKFLLTNNEVEDFENPRVPKRTKDNAHRALTVLGLICENQEGSVDGKTWGDVVECEENDSVNFDDISWENFTLACYRLFSLYLQKVDSGTKCKALSALRGIFVANPQLLLQMDHVGLFEEVMEDSAGIPLQLEALECWKKILINEERRIDGGIADAKMAADGSITISKRIAGDQDGDATLFGGVLTSHSDRLFAMIHSSSPVIRLSTLELLGLLLRQGLVNPNEAVPHLFALQCDVQNDSIQSLALRLLVSEGEKRPDTLRQLIRSGVKQAYSFQRSLNPQKGSVSAIVQNKTGEISSIFDKVFPSVATNRKQRFSLYRSLLGLFDQEDNNSVHRRHSKSIRTKFSSKDLALLSFAAQILAHLPYNSAGDPLFIVHSITNQVTLQGLQTLDKLASFLRPHGLASSDDLEETNADEDALEVAARSKFPSRTHHARPLSSKDFDVAGFADLCVDGAALSLLLRLKSFLCSSYSLSAVRVLEYDPNTKERLCDKGIAKPKFTSPFNGALEEVSTDGIVNKDALIRVYAEFRQMMREENTFSDGTMRGSNDEENGGQPTPKRPRSGSGDSEDAVEDI